MRAIPQLGPRERRVLGVLLEKEQTTPEYYPLTLKAAVAACNQKSNRDPVMDLQEADVLNVLRVLVQEDWVRRVSGARVDRWAHCFHEQFDASDGCKALITLLLLRGAQTPGQLRARGARLHPFESLSEVAESLQDLSQADPPLAVELPREPGQKETRWTLAGEGSESGTAPSASVRHGSASAPSAAAATPPLEAALENRVLELEEEVSALNRRLSELEALLS